MSYSKLAIREVIAIHKDLGDAESYLPVLREVMEKHRLAPIDIYNIINRYAFASEIFS